MDFQHFGLFGAPLGHIGQQVKPIISKGHSMRQFCFFSVFFGAFLHFKRYDHDVYMFLILQNIPERTVEADFWFEPSKMFFWYPKWPRKPKIVEYSTCVSCFNLWNISDKTVETDFWFKASKKFSRAWSSHVDKVLLNTIQNLRILLSCQSMES